MSMMRSFCLCRSIAANHLSHRLSFAMIVHRRLDVVMAIISLSCGCEVCDCTT